MCGLGLDGWGRVAPAVDRLTGWERRGVVSVDGEDGRDIVGEKIVWRS